MANGTITNTITGPAGGPISYGVPVIARLKPMPGFRIDDSTEISGYTSTVADVNGQYTLTLEANLNITPSGTYWEIEEQCRDTAGGPRVWTVNVVAGVTTTLQAARITPSDSTGLAIYLTQASADARYLLAGGGYALLAADNSFTGKQTITRATATTATLDLLVTGDVVPRYEVLANGSQLWSGGSVAADNKVFRNSGTWTVQTADNTGTLKERFSVEANQAAPGDMNIRNVVLNIGNADAATSPAVPIRLFSPTGSTSNLLQVYAQGETGTGLWKTLMTAGGGLAFSTFTGTCLTLRSSNAAAGLLFQIAGTDGKLGWGSATLTADSHLGRSDVATLKADENFHVGADFRHLGSLLGFRNVAAVAMPTALTQTYATATRTHANPTATSVSTTGSTQTIPYGYSSSTQADAIVTTINALIVDVANVKQFVNTLADDLQLVGLEQ